MSSPHFDPFLLLDEFRSAYVLYYTPRGVAVGPNDSLYVADSLNHCIRRIAIDPGADDQSPRGRARPPLSEVRPWCPRLPKGCRSPCPRPPRRRDVPVGSTFLWQQLVRDVEANAPWQRLRRSLLLLLQLLLAVILGLGAYRLLRRGGGRARRPLLVGAAEQERGGRDRTPQSPPPGTFGFVSCSGCMPGAWLSASSL